MCQGHCSINQVPILYRSMDSKEGPVCEQLNQVHGCIYNGPEGQLSLVHVYCKKEL